MLLQMTSAGAMGGGVSSAIARALGAGDRERASALASRALLIGIGFGLVFTIGMLAFGPMLLERLGGRGQVLAQAVGYVQIFFGAAVIPWLMNTLGAVLRGTGNMKLPSAIMLTSSACQIVLGGVLGLGLGPVPQLAVGALLAPHASAMMDVSDGLLLDAARLCAASKCGAMIDLDGLPLSRAYIAERGADRRARLWAATGGDDYALLAALPPDFDPLSLSLPSRTILAPIGTLTDGEELKLFDATGEVPLPEQLGYEHRRT